MWSNTTKFSSHRYKSIGYKSIYVLLTEDKNEDYEIFQMDKSCPWLRLVMGICKNIYHFIFHNYFSAIDFNDLGFRNSVVNCQNHDNNVF